MLLSNDVPAVARVAPRITWPEYRYYQTDEQWQWEKCRLLNLVFASPHDFVEPGGPNVVLRRPNLRTVVKGVGDGNCLFQCFSYILTLRVVKAAKSTDKYATYVHIYVNNVTIAILIHLYGILYGIKITRNLILLGSRVITSIFRTVHNFNWEVGFNG